MNQRRASLIAAIAMFAIAAYAGPVTFNAGSGGPAVPDGLDLSGSNPGVAVTSQIVVPEGTNLVISPGDSVTVTLTNWSHTFLDDLSITLTGPAGGARTLLFGQGGGCDFVATSSYSFNSGNATAIPGDASVCVGGKLPAGSYDISDAAFSSAWPGVNISNTTWTLTVQDRYWGDTQSAGWLWSITFDASEPASGVPEPSSSVAVLAGLGLGGLLLRRRVRQ